ncbi:hypothetical protein PIB30_059661 [Stylosanthes scabra]|uniref:Uncharacterized protein n=1 Tax=Stylosanthes scabra TaxID=79078 RepID=A0ABU6UKV0_9FABA|nr:hypothetical protein [Stylosanthes scabra]
MPDLWQAGSHCCVLLFQIQSPSSNYSAKFRKFHNATSSTPSSNFHNPKAMIANPKTLSYQSWYADSGASHHCTADNTNLQYSLDYQGQEQVYIGNGIERRVIAAARLRRLPEPLPNERDGGSDLGGTQLNKNPDQQKHTGVATVSWRRYFLNRYFSGKVSAAKKQREIKLKDTAAVKNRRKIHRRRISCFAAVVPAVVKNHRKTV